MRLRPIAVLALAGLLPACSQPPPDPAPAVLPASADIGADPLQAVLAASRRFAALRSFHAEMTLHGARAGQATRTAMDYVAPDRYRLQGPAGVQTVIGGTFFLQAEDRVQQVPVPAGVLDHWRSPLPDASSLRGLAVEDRGRADIAGTPTRLYRLDGPQGSGETLQYWIGSDGLPRQIQRDGFNGDQPYRVTLRYSRMDDPTLVVPDPGAAGRAGKQQR